MEDIPYNRFQFDSWASDDEELIESLMDNALIFLHTEEIKAHKDGSYANSQVRYALDHVYEILDDAILKSMFVVVLCAMYVNCPT
jgi:hypothetical protein